MSMVSAGLEAAAPRQAGGPTLQRQRVKTITADNGTEFHNYRELESHLGTEVYFANPHYAWERGTNENTNGLMENKPSDSCLAKHPELLSGIDCRSWHLKSQ
jgi:IS30 family transposase